MIPDLTRGDLIEIRWTDIQEDGSGNPDEAHLAKRTSYALFWETKESDGLPCLVTTSTLDSDGHTQQGWCIYPVGCILAVNVIRRARRGRKRNGLEKSVGSRGGPPHLPPGD